MLTERQLESFEKFRDRFEVLVQAHIKPKLKLKDETISGVTQGKDSTVVTCIENSPGHFVLPPVIQRRITGLGGRAKTNITYTLFGQMAGGPKPNLDSEGDIEDWGPGYGRIITDLSGQKMEGYAKEAWRPRKPRVFFWAPELCRIDCNHVRGRAILTITKHVLTKGKDGGRHYEMIPLFHRWIETKRENYPRELKKSLEAEGLSSFWTACLVAIQMGYAYHGEEEPDVDELLGKTNEELAKEPFYYLPFAKGEGAEVLAEVAAVAEATAVDESDSQAPAGGEAAPAADASTKAKLKAKKKTKKTQ